MKLARKYNALLKQRLRHYAAWSPVTDTYEVGDFGAFRGGVFQKLGNIREFGVNPGATPGGSTTRFSFTSSGATMVRSQAGASVDVFPDAPVQAQLGIQFNGQDSIYIQTGELSVMEMPSVDAVAHQLQGREDRSGRRWKLGWRVVRKVYLADNPVILASSERGVSFSLSGQARALKQLEVGSASVGITVSSTSSDALQVMGGEGPIALDLFKVRVTGRARLESFSADVDGQDEDEGEQSPEPDFDEGWEDEPDDDPEDLFE